MEIGKAVMPGRILFLGTSYLSRYNIPAKVTELTGGRYECTPRFVAGGNTWEKFSELSELLITALKSGTRYDYLVLQEQCRAGVSCREWLFTCLERYGRIAREHQPQIRILLVFPWAHIWTISDKEWRDFIVQQWKELCRALDFTPAPVGCGWFRIFESNPAFLPVLYDPDGTHQSPYGSYLHACILFSAITGENPVGRSKWKTHHWEWEKQRNDFYLWSTLEELDPRKGLYLEEVAWDAYRDFMSAYRAG